MNVFLQAVNFRFVHRRTIALLSFILIFNLLLPSAGNAQYHLMTPDAVLPYAKNTILKAHATAIAGASAKQIAAAGQHMMQPEPLPAVESVVFGPALAAAKAAYNQAHFAEAVADLSLPVASEPQNRFLLFHYARALYQTESTKPQAFEAYQKLISDLDRENGENDSTATIDYWFLEAYWKLGTLQMDQEQWKPAAYNMARFLIGASSLSELTQNPLLYEQALGYLTECYFRLNEPEICRYYGSRTLQFFPKNQYVRPYLAHLPPITKPKKKS
ncbi:hypothetical protein [Hymenobacter convexus]|uniref:hypothetical protein n=1 Tax=Hymenobacter sp. CA1UV-4 TaxID=3063782 RepID=UPI002713EDCF|nr:hypothetical protein [Hymenobacter sp. CA1UV-4]MDO7850029.1 hypothetical protein [Hymenobacter sp. CA1UV-4]